MPILRKECAVIIAAYNEEQVIAQTCRDLMNASSIWDIVVVDDGSRDGTLQSLEGLALEGLGVITLRHPINMGQGAALQTGLTYAERSGYSYMITFDADGQHRPEDALSMLETLRREKLDIVIGSRFLEKSSQASIPLKKQLILKLATGFTNLSTGLKLTDTHNGLRVMTSEAAKKLKITQNGMAHASEILELIAKHQLKYREHPTLIHYTEYSMSKGQKISNSLNILWDLFTRRMKQ